MSSAEPIDGAIEPASPPDRRRIAGNFLAMASTSGIGLAVSLLTSIYIRRVLGPEAIGQVNWSLAVLAYLALIANPGVTTVGQRELAKDGRRAGELVGVLIGLQSLLSLAAYVGVLAIVLWNPRGVTVGWLLLIQGATLFTTAWNTGWILQAHERMAAPSFAALASNVLQIPTLLLLVHGPDDIFRYALITVAFALAVTLFNLCYGISHGLVRLGDFRPTLAGASLMLRESWPLALSQGAILIYYNCDAIILGFVNGDEVVGQYSTAYRLMLVASVGTAALWNAYFPALARTHDKPAEGRALSREYLKLLAWMGLPTAALAFACGRHVVWLMYGHTFEMAGFYFEWLCLDIGITFLNYGIVSVLVPWGRSHLQFQITAAAGLFNLALNLAIIPLYGPWGAVATTLAAEALVLVLGLWARRRRDIFWHPMLPIVGPPLLCSAAVALAIKLLPQSFDRFWWAELAIGAAFLGGCLLAFERPVIARLLRRRGE